MRSTRATSILLLACAVAVLALAGSIAYLAFLLPTIADAQLSATRSALITQVGVTRAAAVSEIRTTRQQVLKLTAAQLQQIEADLNYKLDGSLANLNDRLSDTNQVIDHALAEYDKTALATIGAGFERIDPIAENVATLTDKVNQQEPMVYSRFLATSGELDKTLDATRRMGDAGAKAAPQFTADITSITGYVANFTKPKPPQGFAARMASHLGTVATIAAKLFLLSH